jgi:hypothetical protein
MIFHVGQKVVLVEDDWNDEVIADYPFDLPVKGRVYTIRAMTIGWPEFGSMPALLLEEIQHPHDERFAAGEMAFDRRRFRPVIERKTDISIFTAMLTPNRVNA